MMLHNEKTILRNFLWRYGLNLALNLLVFIFLNHKQSGRFSRKENSYIHIHYIHTHTHTHTQTHTRARARVIYTDIRQPDMKQVTIIPYTNTNKERHTLNQMCITKNRTHI